MSPNYLVARVHVGWLLFVAGSAIGCVGERFGAIDEDVTELPSDTVTVNPSGEPSTGTDSTVVAAPISDRASTSETPGESTTTAVEANPVVDGPDAGAGAGPKPQQGPEAGSALVPDETELGSEPLTLQPEPPAPGASPAHGDGGMGIAPPISTEPGNPPAEPSEPSESTSTGDVEPTDGVVHVEAGTAGSQTAVCADDEQRGEGDHCYFFGAEEVTWSEARDACLARGQGWDLTAINSESEHEWVSSRLADESWIGGVNERSRWSWVSVDEPFWRGGEDGEPVDGAYTRWEETEPSGGANSEQCVRYSDAVGDWYWADLPCGRSYLYVCESNAASD